MEQREFSQALTQLTATALGRMAGLPVVHLAPIRALINEAGPLIREQLASLPGPSRDVLSWSSMMLKEHRRLRLGLLYLAPGGRLPIHDHPCNISVMEVIDGEVVVELFERGEKRPRRRTVPMKRRERRVVGIGNKAEITPDGPNLHCISSESGALILDAVYSSNGQWKRHWYMPISDEGTHVNALILDDPVRAQTYPERREADSRGRKTEASQTGPQFASGNRRRTTRKHHTGKRLRT